MDGENQNNLLDAIEKASQNEEVFQEITSEKWQDRTGLDEETLCGAIETIIFMSDKPISLQKIKQLIDEEIPLKTLHQALETLQADYEVKRHGIRLVEVAEGYQFRTKPNYGRFVQDLFKINGLQLTQGTLEVLAIIAYRQPVTKFDVEKIRGVDSSHLIRTLMDKKLVKLVGRSDDIGRPSLYGTTMEFLDVFNLPDISSLPPEYELEEIVESQKLKITDLSNIRSGDQTKFIFDEVDELDNLASQIRQIQTSTDLTSELTKKPKADDSTPRKSAFDILEEQVSRSQIKEQMKQASESGFINQFIDPSVVGEISEGLNIPDEQEDEDFQMIDLDTGLPIEEQEIEVEVELEADSLDEFDQKDELVESLDKAFEKFKEIKEAQVVENTEEVEAPPVPSEDIETTSDDDLRP